MTLAELFTFNHRATHMNLEGLTHEDSLVQPPAGANCLNWVLGHVVASRNEILELLGEPPTWTEQESARYDRGSKGIHDAAEARPLPELITAFDRSQERILAGCARLTPERLAERFSERHTIAQRLGFLQFHETYHVGQMGLLRRIAGKEGAIK